MPSGTTAPKDATVPTPRRVVFLRAVEVAPTVAVSHSERHKASRTPHSGLDGPRALADHVHAVLSHVLAP